MAASVTEAVGQLAGVVVVQLRHLQAATAIASDDVFSNSTIIIDGIDSTNATNGTSSGPQQPQNNRSGHDAYEFVAFLLWYLFLVLCCVVPTCCAYRRRRLVEARIAEQQASISQMERQNIYMLSGLRHHSSQNDTEYVREQRGGKITEKLKDTTMTVGAKDIVSLSDEEQKNLACSLYSVKVVDKGLPNRGGGEEEGSAIAVEYDVEAADPESTYALQLATTGTDDASSSRMVPAACAICLCPYEKEDEVTWSPKEECQHAFHKDCIIPWLAKSEEPKCPCCRQDFCDPVPLSQLETNTNNNFFAADFHGFRSNSMDDNRRRFFNPHFVRTVDGSPFLISSLEMSPMQNGDATVNNNNNNSEDTPAEGSSSLNGSPFIIHYLNQQTRGGVDTDNNNEEQRTPNDDSNNNSQSEADRGEAVGEIDVDTHRGGTNQSS